MATVSITPATPRRHIARWLSTVVLLAVAALFLVPLTWVVLSAVDPQATVSLTVPGEVSTENFQAILTPELTFRPLLNSLVLSLGTGLATVLAAVLAAYPLSRYQLRFRRSFLYGILFGTCLPITAIMVPVYALFVRLNLLDSMTGTIAFLAAAALPMAIWMAKNFMDSVPVSLEEAAWVDGASAMQTLGRIVVPLMRPGIAVVFIFVFTQAWGNFFVPFVLLFDPTLQPAAVAIYQFFGTYGTVAYGQLAAFSILYAAPVMLLYLVVQRLAGGSFALAGAVKG